MNLGDPRKIQQKESAYRAWYRECCNKVNAFAQPIESNATGAGIADLYGVTPRKAAYWMEFKVMSCIDDAIPFEPGQLNWLYLHAQLGGTSLVNILVDDTVYIFSCRCVDRMTQKLKDGPAVRGSVLKIRKKCLRDAMDDVLAQIENVIRIDGGIVLTP